MLVEMKYVDSKEEILGKSGRIERKGLWLQAWGKQRTWFKFLQVEMIAKTKLHRTILDTLDSAHLVILMM